MLIIVVSNIKIKNVKPGYRETVHLKFAECVGSKI